MTAVVRSWNYPVTTGRSILLVLLTLASMLSAPAIAGTKLSLEPVSATKNSLSIAVDPRIELISIVQYLSDYREIGPSLVTNLDFSYRKDVDAWFAKSRNHPVIALFNQIASRGFTYDAPPHAVLYLNADLTLNDAIYKDDPMDVTRAGGKKRMAALANALRAFALKSDFPEFYRKHGSFYKTITQETIKKIGDENVVEQLEQYYGEKRSNYTVVISSLLGGGNFGPQVERKNGFKEVYCIMGPWKEDKGIPQFGSPDFFHQLQWHEFGHSFVNPAVTKHPDLWEQHSDLYSPMESKMKPMAYGEWRTVVCESVLRAVTTRLAYRFSGQEAGDREVRRQQQSGFVFTGALTKKLEEYEADRAKYPTFDSFLPELLKVLDGFTESSVKEALTDNTILLVDGIFKSIGALVYDIPYAEGRDNTVKSIEQMHDMFFKKLEMLDAQKLDESMLKDKLKGGFALYTTTDSKLFKAATEPLNIRIDAGMLHWNGVDAAVNELRIILIGKNPYRDGNCLIYAAGSNKMLIGINGCFHGQCSYHIFRDSQLLKEGFYNEKFVITGEHK